MNDEQLAKLMASPRLPTIPTVALRIIQLVQTPDVSISKLADTIAADPALAAKILKTANSGAYGRVRGVGKLRDAMMVLGLRNVKMLALGFSLVGNMSGVKGSKLDYTMFWRRSAVAACSARAAASRLGLGEHTDEAFLGGLMHAIGMVAFDCALGEQYAVPAQKLDEGFVAVHASELEQLGLGHMALGGMLTRAWNLPPNLVAALEHYADPASAAPEFRTTVSCVTLGAHCGDIGTATNSGRALSEFRSAAKVLGLTEAAAQAIIEEGLEQAAVLLQIFEGPGAETIVPAEILSRAHEALLELSLALAQETDRMADEEAELRTQAQVDALTSVANRRHFDEVIAQQVAISLRYSRPLSFLIIDVDHFKLVNDTYGHPVGDVVLRDLAARIKSSVRAADFVARYGGEEFAVLLSETGGEGARDAAERVRLAISATPIGIAPAKFVPVTVSVGLATLGEAGAHSVASLISAADTALYAAKHGGRNQVVMAAA